MPKRRELFATVPLSPQDAEKSCYGKREFANKNEARDSAAKFRRKTGEGLRPYKCMVCPGWHLTHHPAEENSSIRRALRSRSPT